VDSSNIPRSWMDLIIEDCWYEILFKNVFREVVEVIYCTLHVFGWCVKLGDARPNDADMRYGPVICDQNTESNFCYLCPKCTTPRTLQGVLSVFGCFFYGFFSLSLCHIFCGTFSDSLQFLPLLTNFLCALSSIFCFLSCDNQAWELPAGIWDLCANE